MRAVEEGRGGTDRPEPALSREILILSRHSVCGKGLMRSMKSIESHMQSGRASPTCWNFFFSHPSMLMYEDARFACRTPRVYCNILNYEPDQTRGPGWCYT